ncbi:DUF2345 domain-containing protein, partial [Neisseria sp. 74A18]|uniref:DUF2345 domain-containing protein n=1 Tax=Neisseria sp. 74A18 TaxID=1696094 RepID=UPI000A68AE9D
TATPQSQLHTAGQHIHHISGGDTDISAGSNFTAHAVGSVNLFAQSKGAKLQANQGKVEIQAQNDEMQINALKDATITSSAGKVIVAAKDEILLTSGGGYIKIKDGNIELGCPKMVWVKCAGFQVMGLSSISNLLPILPNNQQQKETMGIQIKRIGTQEITGISLDYKLKTAGDETLFSSTTQNENGLGGEHDKEQIYASSYLLIGKESDGWQLFVYEADNHEGN